MLVAVNIVQHQGGAKTFGQSTNCGLKQESVGQTFNAMIGYARLDRGAAVFFSSFCKFIQGNFVHAPFPEAHEDGVASYAIQPGGKRRVAVKIAQAPKNGEKSFLSQILREGGITDHAQTERVHAVRVQTIKAFERGGIALAGQFQGFAFR